MQWVSSLIAANGADDVELAAGIRVIRVIRGYKSLPHHSGVSKGISSGLWPDGEAMRFGSDRDRFDGSSSCIDGVNNLIETS
jgi:hypothetical protein